MADTKISDLAAVTDIVATDEFVLARAGVTNKIDASDLASSLGSQPSIVTSLPGSPSDDDEIYLQVGSGDTAVLWHLKYDSGITDSYKWRFLGGAPLFSNQTALGNTSSTTYVELNSGVPAVTLPGIGIYEMHHGFDATTPGGLTFAIANVKTNGSNPGDDNDAVENKPVGNDALAGVSRVIQRDVSSVSTSAVAVCVYRTAGAGTDFVRRFLRVLPVRLG